MTINTSLLKHINHNYQAILKYIYSPMVINFQMSDSDVLQEFDVPVNYQRMIKSCVK